jgi:hypothetical protein
VTDPRAAVAVPDPSALPVLARLAIDGAEVARYVDGGDLPGVLSPRPFLHPVRTQTGVPVTDERPEDHPWHLGAGFAVQDVGGHNLWGGRTYVRGVGYTWREDHGRMRHEGFERRTADGFVADLTWLGSDGSALVSERREVRAQAPTTAAAVTDEPADPSGEPLRTWILSWYTTVTVLGSTAVALGSPATNGRDGGGYGGFFWRLPRMDEMTICTPDGAGEATVHGTRATWLAVRGRVSGPHQEVTGPVTLVAAGLDDATSRDAWFVRAQGYPGFGSSLALEAPLVLGPGESARRAFAVAIADGYRDPESVAEHLVALREG